MKKTRSTGADVAGIQYSLANSAVKWQYFFDVQSDVRGNSVAEY